MDEATREIKQNTPSSIFVMLSSLTGCVFVMEMLTFSGVVMSRPNETRFRHK